MPLASNITKGIIMDIPGAYNSWGPSTRDEGTPGSRVHPGCQHPGPWRTAAGPGRGGLRPLDVKALGCAPGCVFRGPREKFVISTGDVPLGVDARYTPPPPEAQAYTAAWLELFARSEVWGPRSKVAAATQELARLLNGCWWLPSLVHHCSRARDCCQGDAFIVPFLV